MGLAQNNKYNFFGKKLPAWVLLAALIAVGAGAATGLVLKDQINGTTTIAVSQALQIQTAPTAGGSYDEFLGTSNDNKAEWAAHFEANNGDEFTLTVPIKNEAAQTVVGVMTMTVPDGITVAETGSTSIVEIASHTWKFSTGGGATTSLVFTIAIEDAQPTGFYELTGVIVPVNV